MQLIIKRFHLSSVVEEGSKFGFVIGFELIKKVFGHKIIKTDMLFTCSEAVRSTFCNFLSVRHLDLELTLRESWLTKKVDFPGHFDFLGKLTSQVS